MFGLFLICSFSHKIFIEYRCVLNVGLVLVYNDEQREMVSVTLLKADSVMVGREGGRGMRGRWSTECGRLRKPSTAQARGSKAQGSWISVPEPWGVKGNNGGALVKQQVLL